MNLLGDMKSHTPMLYVSVTTQRSFPEIKYGKPGYLAYVQQHTRVNNLEGSCVLLPGFFWVITQKNYRCWGCDMREGEGELVCKNKKLL